MKKRLLTLIIIPSTLLGLATFAHSQPDTNSLPGQDKPHHKQHIHRDLNINESQAKTLVEAMLIKFGNGKESILKIETISLEKNKNFYIVYLDKDGDSKANRFIIVDGQNGHTIPFPMKNPPLRKFKQRMFQNDQLPVNQPPPQIESGF